MKQNQFEFKPFDRVLVRDYGDDPWRAMHYSHFDEMQKHYCGSSYWIQCIPYNDETKHLIGTTNNYQKPEQKVWKVTNLKTNTIHTMTQPQFQHFIRDVFGNNNGCCYRIENIND